MYDVTVFLDMFPGSAPANGAALRPLVRCREARDPNRTICTPCTVLNTFNSAMLTTCRHKMNEALHLQERVHIKHCKQPPRITAPVHATPIPTSVRAPLKAPHWALRGYPTGPPRRHPLRGGLRPSGRPHDERPPLHGDRTPSEEPSYLHALRARPLAHKRPPARGQRPLATSRYSRRRGATAAASWGSARQWRPRRRWTWC